MKRTIVAGERRRATRGTNTRPRFNADRLGNWIGLLSKILAAIAPIYALFNILALANYNVSSAKFVIAHADFVSLAAASLVESIVLMIPLAILLGYRVFDNGEILESYAYPLSAIALFALTDRLTPDFWGDFPRWLGYAGLVAMGALYVFAVKRTQHVSQDLRRRHPRLAEFGMNAGRYAANIVTVMLAVGFVVVAVASVAQRPVAYLVFDDVEQVNRVDEPRDGLTDFYYEIEQVHWFAEGDGGTWMLRVGPALGGTKDIVWHAGTPDMITYCTSLDEQDRCLEETEELFVARQHNNIVAEEAATTPSPSAGSPSSTPEPSEG